MIQYLQTGASLYANTLGSLARAQVDRDEALAAQAKAKSGDSKLISDKLLDKLQEKGIPVDVDNFMDKMASLEDSIDKGFGVNKRSIYALQAQANRIIQQADYLKQAEERAESNESFGEVAVGGRGELFIYDSDNHKIDTVSAAQYDASKHGPALTVGELIEQRKFNPSKAYDTDITRVVNDNIGMSKIQDYIQKIVNTVGNAETTNEAYIDLAGYIGKEMAKKPTAEQLASLQTMNNMIKQLGADAIFKIKDTEQGKNLTAAFNYISSVLPRDMKTQLIGRNVAAGNPYDTGLDYVGTIIASALSSSNQTKSDHYLDYDAQINTAAGTRAGEAKDQQRNLSPLEQLVQGSLGKRDYKLISSKSPELSLNLHGNGIGSLASINGKIVDKVPLTQAMAAGLAPVVDELHIMAGSQKINPAQLETILYDGGDVINIWAPVDADGNVDLEQLQTLQAIQDICDNNPQLLTSDKNQLLAQYGLSGQFDEQGVFHGDPRTMGQFLVMTGLTSDKVIDEDLNLFVDKLSEQEKSDAFKQIDRIYGQLNKGLNGDAKFEFQKGWFNVTTDLYRVPIFMKLGQTAQIDVGTFSGKGPIVRTPSYQEQLAYDLILNNRSTQLITPSAAALFNE